MWASTTESAAPSGSWRRGRKPPSPLPPVAVVQDYTKRVKKISRLDWDVLQLMLCEEIARTSAQKVVVGIERPMINPTRFHASVSAARCLEATLITLKMVDIFYRRNLPIARSFLDSKEGGNIRSFLVARRVRQT